MRRVIEVLIITVFVGTFVWIYCSATAPTKPVDPTTVDWSNAHRITPAEFEKK